MGVNNLIKANTISASGSTIEYFIGQPYTQYVITGGSGADLVGGITIGLDGGDTPYSGLTFSILYQGNVVYTGGNEITVFGTALTASQATKTLEITAIYIGSSWTVVVNESPVFQQIFVELDGNGGTYTCDSDSLYDYYFYGSATLSSSWTITAGTPSGARSIRVTYNANLALSGNDVTVFGQVLTSQQALAGNTIIQANYNTVGAAWTAVVVEDSNVTRTVEGVFTTVYASGALNVALNPNIDKTYQEVIGSGVLVGNINYQSTGTIKDGEKFTIKYDGTFTPNGYTVTFFGVQLTDDEVQTGNVTVTAVWNEGASTWSTQKILGAGFTNGELEILTIQTSFETGEEGAVKVKVPYACLVTNVQTCVNKTIAGTDDGLIAMGVGLPPTSLNPASITIPMSSAVGTVIDTPIISSNTLAADDYLVFTTAKFTDGGRVICYVTIQRTA